MFVPVITKCGHNFCYQCLSVWICANETCPSCRAVITETPYFNYPVQDTVNTLMDTLKSLNGNILPADIVRDRDSKIKEYKHDEKRNNLFKKVFSQTGEAIIDNSDGVARCSECHWEVEGNRCPNCHLRLRNPYTNHDDGDGDDDDDDDDDDGDDSEMDFDFERRIRRIEDEEGSSDDSFIDDRDINDLETHDGNSILSDDDSEYYTYPANPYDGSWQDEAFEDNELSDTYIQEEFQMALRRSMNRPVHHAIPISEDDDEDDDLCILERVSTISDDEDDVPISLQRRTRRTNIAESDEE